MAFNSLSGRFLVLAVIFVMIAEISIFVPSVARFRENYLQNRLDLAQLAALALLATPADENVSPELNDELLETADVLNVVLQRNSVRELVLDSEMPEMVEETYDISHPAGWDLMRDAVEVFLRPGDRVIRVIGQTQHGTGAAIEITLHEMPLRDAMIAYGIRVLYLSLVISVATALLLFVSVRLLIVRPIKRVIDNMVAFRENPEDGSRIITPSAGAQEIREAETALREMQSRLAQALRQKERLAALGGAVAKISHDLRNMLATAQLLVDGIGASADPRVQRIAPKLVGSISRAVSLCERTLTYGKAEEPLPALARVSLLPLVRDALECEIELARTGRVRFLADVPEDMEVRADPEQLFRVLTNLVHNAAQAIQSTNGSGEISVEARQGARVSRIRVRDTGPGLPEKAKSNLFKPFEGGVRRGGSGLGLVIAAELVRGHGGVLSLESSGPEGTVFEITLPHAAGRARAQTGDAPPEARAG